MIRWKILIKNKCSSYFTGIYGTITATRDVHHIIKENTSSEITKQPKKLVHRWWTVAVCHEHLILLSPILQIGQTSDLYEGLCGLSLKQIKKKE